LIFFETALRLLLFVTTRTVSVTKLPLPTSVFSDKQQLSLGKGSLVYCRLQDMMSCLDRCFYLRIVQLKPKRFPALLPRNVEKDPEEQPVSRRLTALVLVGRA
jgi:hypothetical protein